MVKPIDMLYMTVGDKKICRQCGKTVNDQGLAKVSHATKCKPPKLKIWNGRGDHRHMPGHFYACATTKKEVVELITQAGYYPRMTVKELNTYWADGCWGVAMEGITPEKGVWFVPKKEENNRNFVPQRLI